LLVKGQNKAMIVLFTDFGRNGPYNAQMIAVIRQYNPALDVIDLIANAPAYNVRASAFLLSSFVSQFPSGSVFLAVVDPGVGSERLPVVLEADGYWFVGPGNGLMDVVMRRASNPVIYEVDTKGFALSDSFHGRDLFAPVAATIAANAAWPHKHKLSSEPVHNNWPDDLYEIIYIDDYGNAYTGIRGDCLKHEDVIEINGHRLAYARTFSRREQGQSLWYVNSIGLVEIAVNQGSASEMLGIQIGMPVILPGA
jgi:S-adenosylmethionine hydrolase